MSIRLFNSLLNDPFLNNRSNSIFQLKDSDFLPRTDIKENEHSIIFHAELPGMTINDVHVELLFAILMKTNCNCLILCFDMLHIIFEFTTI